MQQRVITTNCFKERNTNQEKLDTQPNEDIATDPDINLQSYFGRINLGFDSRYLLTVNYRRDGTSRFSKENRWGNFSGAACVELSEESFFKR
jgi:iron complex outermembrane receptor protein